MFLKYKIFFTSFLRMFCESGPGVIYFKESVQTLLKFVTLGFKWWNAALCNCRSLAQTNRDSKCS